LGIHISITNHTFNCETAWGPCIEFVQKVCKKYQLSASVEFYEPGANFAGMYDINENGKLVKKVNMECEFDDYEEEEENYYREHVFHFLDILSRV